MFAGGPLFDRENFAEPAFDVVLRTKREQLVQLNRLFEVTIQQEPSRRLADAGAVAVEARKLVPLVLGNYIVPGARGGQRCMVCGIGRYDEPKDGAYAGAGRVAGIELRVLVCPECGHLLTFRPTTDPARKTWGM